jgi:hypothetical protein
MTGERRSIELMINIGDRRRRINDEDCRDRRHWFDWLEHRRHSAPGPREVVTASPKGGVNAVAGEGVKEAMAGA